MHPDKKGGSHAAFLELNAAHQASSKLHISLKTRHFIQWKYQRLFETCYIACDRVDSWSVNAYSKQYVLFNRNISATIFVVMRYCSSYILGIGHGFLDTICKLNLQYQTGPPLLVPVHACHQVAVARVGVGVWPPPSAPKAASMSCTCIMRLQPHVCIHRHVLFITWYQLCTTFDTI